MFLLSLHDQRHRRTTTAPFTAQIQSQFYPNTITNHLCLKKSFYFNSKCRSTSQTLSPFGHQQEPTASHHYHHSLSHHHSARCWKHQLHSSSVSPPISSHSCTSSKTSAGRRHTSRWTPSHSIGSTLIAPTDHSKRFRNQDRKTKHHQHHHLALQ